MKYANLFDFWLDKRQRYVIFTHAQFRQFDCELRKLILFFISIKFDVEENWLISRNFVAGVSKFLWVH